MKALKRLLFLCLLAMLAACTEDALTTQPEVVPAAGDEFVDLISMVVPDIEMDVTTRTKLFEDGDELKFTWQDNDAIGVVPMSGRPLSFPIHAENAGKNTALFDGGGWALRTDMEYAAFYPINAKNQNSKINEIVIDYTGQTQGNYTNYDFLAADAVQPSNGQVTFNMQRLSAILKITIQMPAGSTARYGSLIASSPVFKARDHIDLSRSTISRSGIEVSNYINTDLGLEQSNTGTWNYTVFMMIPPADLSGQNLIFRITSDIGYAYEATLTGKNFEAGKAYLLSGAASGAVIWNVNLIEAAEKNDGVEFVKNSDNSINVNDNIDMIAKVKSIRVEGYNDPSICDEIGYFTNLTYLSCNSNYFNSLDVSRLKSLESLLCNYNDLYYLDVSQNTSLQLLYVVSNGLTSLDVSKNTALSRLNCSSNFINSLDLSKNQSLTQLYCQNNHLKSLNVSSNKALTRLFCYENGLTSLDVSMLDDLTWSSLFCGRQKDKPGISTYNFHPILVKVNDEMTDYYFENGVPSSESVDKFNWLVEVE